jgi:hypothetical protein
MTELNQVTHLLEQLTNHRLDIKDFLYERFDKLGGSPDRVLEAIESQVNQILDERDSLLTNVFEELTTQIKTLEEANKILSGEMQLFRTHCKEEHIPTNTR